MAEYSFESNPAGSDESELEIKVHRWGWNFGSKRGHVGYDEQASGTLTITSLEEVEAEALKRGIFAPNIIESRDADVKAIIFNDHERVAKLEEINNGSLVSPATLSRVGSLLLDRRAAIEDPRLKKPVIGSYAGNMLSVRTIMLDSVMEEYRKDGKAQEGHFAELASVADRMHSEVLEVVRPDLIAVHGLSIATLEEAIIQHYPSAQETIIIDLG